jgi:uncharacterized protein YndB with AHSA1/START domain
MALASKSLAIVASRDNVMADIFQDFPVSASADLVFRAVTTPDGLDRWWTLRATGTAVVGAVYELNFGPAYEWRGRVTRCDIGREFELLMTDADSDWKGTRVGFRLDTIDDGTMIRFHHIGWPEPNEHYRISAHCWAMYLRLLRRYLEHGEVVPYDLRLTV